jgi:hypothetical protein
MAAATRLIAGTSGSPASIISAKFTPSHAQVYRNDEEEREDSTLLDNLNNSSSGSSTARWHSIDRASERHSRKKLWLGCVALILAAAAAALALESVCFYLIARLPTWSLSSHRRAFLLHPVSKWHNPPKQPVLRNKSPLPRSICDARL